MRGRKEGSLSEKDEGPRQQNDGLRNSSKLFGRKPSIVKKLPKLSSTTPPPPTPQQNRKNNFLIYDNPIYEARKRDAPYYRLPKQLCRAEMLILIVRMLCFDLASSGNKK